MSSGLLPRDWIEALVLRRSARGKGGDPGFLLELFRESQENGLVSFLVTAGGGAGFSWRTGGGGGGGNLTGDIWPERPCRLLADAVEPRESRGGNFGSRSGGLVPSSSNDTSSMSDVTDIRCAVSKGDLAGVASSVDVSETSSSLLICSAPSLALVATSGSSGAEESTLGSCAIVSTDSRLLRSDRDRDCERSECGSGRGVISDASSKLSPSLSELCVLVGLSGFLSSSMS